MSVTIKLNSVFYELTNNQEAVQVPGNTIRECLDSLVSLFPGLKGVLFDPEGKLSALVIFQGETILPNTLDTPVTESNELTILPLIYGG
jgi:molybdopterin converting factor small subunit